MVKARIQLAIVGANLATRRKRRCSCYGRCVSISTAGSDPSKRRVSDECGAPIYGSQRPLDDIEQQYLQHTATDAFYWCDRRTGASKWLASAVDGGTSVV